MVKETERYSKSFTFRIFGKGIENAETDFVESVAICEKAGYTGKGKDVHIVSVPG